MVIMLLVAICLVLVIGHAEAHFVWRGKAYHWRGPWAEDEDDNDIHFTL